MPTGYKSIRRDGKVYLEARVIAGVMYDPTKEVHHLNGDKMDNRLCNLIVIDRQSHHRIHHNWKLKDGIWHKKCLSCQQYKPVTAYYKRLKTVQSKCKECKKNDRKL